MFKNFFQKNKSTTSSDGVAEYPCALSSLDFVRVVKTFFELHAFKLKPSAPTALHQSWWHIALEDMQKSTVYVQIQTSSTLGMRVQLFERTQGNVMQVGWSGVETPEAQAIIDYTIDELRLALMAVAKARSPQTQAPTLMGSLVQKRTGQKLQPVTKFVEPIVEKAFWPSPQDYNEAVQNPLVNFECATLRNSQAETTALGIPRAATGAFASVYKLNNYAVKCFLTLVHDQKERYEAISNCILNDDLEYTVDFEFIQKGILVRGKWFPVLRMDWVSGSPLNLWVEDHLKDTNALQDLADEFQKMMKRLRDNGIAHGDLQHGNILITQDGIRLVDYDGMFVPGMDGMVSNELGHRNYQHPQRHPTHFGPWLDNFSAWVIYVSLISLSIDPSLWHHGVAGDESLILAKQDFVAPHASALLAKMCTHESDTIRQLAEGLLEMAEGSIAEVPYLESSITNGKLRL